MTTKTQFLAAYDRLGDALSASRSVTSDSERSEAVELLKKHAAALTAILSGHVAGSPAHPASAARTLIEISEDRVLDMEGK